MTFLLTFYVLVCRHASVSSNLSHLCVYMHLNCLKVFTCYVLNSHVYPNQLNSFTCVSTYTSLTCVCTYTMPALWSSAGRRHTFQVT